MAISIPRRWVLLLIVSALAATAVLIGPTAVQAQEEPDVEQSVATGPLPAGATLCLRTAVVDKCQAVDATVSGELTVTITKLEAQPAVTTAPCPGGGAIIDVEGLTAGAKVTATFTGTGLDGATVSEDVKRTVTGAEAGATASVCP